MPDVRGSHRHALTRRPWRGLRRTLGLALVVAALGGCNRAADLPPQAHPVIILDIDTLRADHLGCYGYHRDTSPNIDRLASEGFRFAWAFSQAPNTGPSQTSILTSLYPSVHGNITDDDRVPDEVTTLAEIMLANGFTTAGIVDGGYMSSYWNIHQGFELYHGYPTQGFEVIAPHAIRWLRANHRKDFLLLIHTYDAHTPYDPPEPYRSMFLDGIKPSTPGFEPDTKQMWRLMKEGREGKLYQLTEEDVEYTQARYDGGIRYIDDWIGRILDECARLGLLERATIILLSDHGEEFQEHGSVLHEKLYSTVTHIPLIIRPPGGVEPQTFDDVVESIDVMPTILELTGIRVSGSQMQGRSLAPLMQGETLPPRRAIGESPFFGLRLHVAMNGHHLLQTLTTGEVELYENHTDTSEQNDVAPEHPELVSSMLHQLEDWQRTVERSVRPQQTGQTGGTLDPGVEDQLRALGYIAPLPEGTFADGFESGDTDHWLDRQQ